MTSTHAKIISRLPPAVLFVAIVRTDPYGHRTDRIAAKGGEEAMIKGGTVWNNAPEQ